MITFFITCVAVYAAGVSAVFAVDWWCGPTPAEAITGQRWRGTTLVVCLWPACLALLFLLWIIKRPGSR
jgi:hypothetical protein